MYLNKHRKVFLRVVDRSLCKYVIRNDLCATKGIKNTVSFCILNPFIQRSNAEINLLKYNNENSFHK